MRILTLAFVALTLTLAPGSANAGFVVIFDDLDTPEVDLRIEDQDGENDHNTAQGLIGFDFDAGLFQASGTAASKPAHGGVSTPLLLLDVQFVRHFGSSLRISVTDTDFNSALPGGAATYTVGLGSGDTIQFDFFGDSGNGEFIEGFLIGSEAEGPGEVDVPFTDVIGPADPVGSLTMSAVLEVDAADGFATFIIALELGTVGADCSADAECDDERYCNGLETCEAETCVAGEKPCTGEDETCLEESDECQPPECLDNNDCNDFVFCNGEEECDPDGVCKADGQSPCAGGNACVEEINECIDAQCSLDADCNDLLFCTGEETCIDGLCRSSGSPCAETEYCDEDTNQCGSSTCSVDDDCSDGVFCNGEEVCEAGYCHEAPFPPCTEGLQECVEATDSCGPLECERDDECDDGVFCNGVEECGRNPDVCQAGDGYPCLGNEVCNEEFDQCYEPECDADSICDNGQFCDGVETCVDFLCEAGSNPCGEGEFCDEEFDECTSAPPCSADSDCIDGVFCNGIETCEAGECQAGAAPCPEGAYCLEQLDYCYVRECTPGRIVQVFRTSERFTGNVGGLAGADETCTSAAAAVGLGGSWTAWLSDETTDARDRIPDSEYRLLDGRVVATSNADLLDGTLNAAINLDETGAPVGDNPWSWTATRPDGTWSGNDCFGWTAAVHDQIANQGDNNSATTTWTQLPSTTPCDFQRGLYCFSSDVPVDSACDDGEFCDGVEGCGSLGRCLDGTPPCGELEACYEETDQCDLAPAGAVPDGRHTRGIPLTVGKTAAPDSFSLAWGPSCNATDADYAIYEGELGNFGSHVPIASPHCTTGGATSVEVTLSEGNRYFLVVPLGASGLEGSYGLTSAGTPRAASSAACAVQGTGGCCSVDGDCEDSLYCTGTETCNAGLCQTASRCVNEVCLEETDECVACIDNRDCFNGLFCDGQESCTVDMECLPGPGNPCAAGDLPVCDEEEDRCVLCLEDAHCDDADVCTIDSCVAEACAHEFVPSYDPPCKSENPLLQLDATCAIGLGESEVCFEFLNGLADEEPGGADEIAGMSWCVGWPSENVSFDCADSDADGVPDDITFFGDEDLTTNVSCTLEDENCRLRLSVVDLTPPLDTFPDSVLACAQFEVDSVQDFNFALTLENVAAADVNGMSFPVITLNDSIRYDDCCRADCNGDGVIDVADAVAIMLEFSDDDGADICDTLEVVPYDGVPCCDCNGDEIIDIADSVCVVEGGGTLECPTDWSAQAAAWATDSTEAGDELARSATSDRRDRIKTRRGNPRSGIGARFEADEALSMEQHVFGRTVVVPLVFKQGADDGQPGGADELTAFSICLDFDQDQLEFDPADRDGDGVTDGLGLQLLSSHSPIVRVDLTRQSCELQIGMIDFSSPSEPLQDGTLAEIQFRRIGRGSEGIWVRPGPIDRQSFADVLGTSVRGYVLVHEGERGEAEPEGDDD